MFYQQRMNEMKKIQQAYSKRNRILNDPKSALPIAIGQWRYGFLIILLAVLFTACQKQQSNETQNETKVSGMIQDKMGPGPLPSYEGLSTRTFEQLLEVRQATAKYHNISNAFDDQYVDIGLKMENMGYHFLKSEFVSPVFDLRKPPILVYNKRVNGDFELVAVEYAVPIDPQSPHTPPEGFSGSADQWDFNTLNTGWWTLHAWVWKFNPSGVFNPTNPSVIVR
jgi:hypothetical protein